MINVTDYIVVNNEPAKYAEIIDEKQGEEIAIVNLFSATFRLLAEKAVLNKTALE